MHVTSLGVGGAFTERFYQSNYLVELPGCRLLIDAGTTLRYSLKASGYSAQNVDAIALTHFHSDHVGGVEELLQRCRYIHNHRPLLYVMPDQLPLLESLIALHGVTPQHYAEVCVITKDYVTLKTNSGQYRLEYFSTAGLHAEVTSNYAIGIKREAPGPVRRILFTGDIAVIEKSQLGRLVADEDTAAVFHDCYIADSPSAAHVSLEQIKRFYSREQLGKIYATHYRDDVEKVAGQITAAGLKIAVQGEKLTW